MNEILKYALQYHEKGWNVIPVDIEKRPKVKWKKWTEAKQTKQDVINMFSYENEGIAVIVGEVSGLSIVDVDVSKEGQVGKVDDLPITHVVKTPSGGWHYYYRYQAGGSSHDLTKNDGTGRDYKYSGGYVVAPPTRAKYMKYGQIVEGEYTVAMNEEIASYPAHLLAKKEQTKTNPLEVIVPPSDAREDIAKKKLSLDKVVKGTSGRNPALYQYAHELSQIMPYEAMIEHVKMYNKNCLVPPIEENEVVRVSNYAWESGVKKKQPKEEQEAAVEPQDVIISGIELTKSFSSILGDGSKSYPHWETGIDWFDEFTRGIQKRTILTAPSNAGKTMMALQICLSGLEKGKPILYFDFEQGQANLYARMLSMEFSKYDTEDYLVRGQKLIKEDPEVLQNIEKLSHKMETFGYSSLHRVSSLDQVEEVIRSFREKHDQEPLVIMDQMRGMLTKTEGKTHYEQTQMFANWTEQKALSLDSTFLIIAPQSKTYDNSNEINSVSGSSDVGYSADSLIVLSKKKKKKESQSSGFFSNKTEYHPWDKSSLKISMAKSRTPKSGSEKSVWIADSKISDQKPHHIEDFEENEEVLEHLNTHHNRYPILQDSWNE